MKKINILYWTITGLFAAFMIFSSISNVTLEQQAVDLIHTQLGYPLYFMPFIGVAKILGAIVLVIPGFNRIKEWAYSGLMFDLLGAAYSFYSVGIGFVDMSFMLLPVSFCALSYYFHHKRLSNASN